MIKLIFFDWSGTLCDDYEDFSLGASHYFINYPIFRFLLFNRFSTACRYLLTKQNLYSIDLYPQKYRSVFKIFTLYPDIQNLLAYINEHNITIGIISFQSRELIKNALQQKNISQFVNIIEGGLLHKGMLIQQYRKKLNLTAKEVLFITDTAEDIREVNKNAIVCAVTGGYDTEDRLIKAKPSILLTDRKDIIKIIQKYNTNN